MARRTRKKRKRSETGGRVAASAQGTVKTGLDIDLDVLSAAFTSRIKLGKFFPLASNSACKELT